MEGAKRLKIQSFRDLRVWQESHKLSVGIYKISEKFPKHEIYGLGSQMTRAAVSVSSNIAEGFGRRGAREKDQFYSVANGSLTELENQILIAEGIGYINTSLANRVMAQCETVHKLLYGLQRANSKH
jgi:four helix bundle protein